MWTHGAYPRRNKWQADEKQVVSLTSLALKGHSITGNSLNRDFLSMLYFNFTYTVPVFLVAAYLLPTIYLPYQPYLPKSNTKWIEMELEKFHSELLIDISAAQLNWLPVLSTKTDGRTDWCGFEKKNENNMLILLCHETIQRFETATKQYKIVH